ncbi:DUF4232 domain-containing protein [Rhodanobacter sp. IGA1.0]
MKRPAASRMPSGAGPHLPGAASGRRLLRTSLAAALALALMACTSQSPQTDATRADAAPPGTTRARISACAPSQLAFALDPDGGRFNGMSHSGTMLVLRNTGAAACTIPARPLPSFADSRGQTLNIVAQASTGTDAASRSPITLAPGAVVTSDMHWVSGDVYDNGHCEAPTRLTLVLGRQQISTAFTGRLCGAGGQPSTYALSPFTPAAASVSTAPKPMACTCDDGRTVPAVYSDTEGASATLRGGNGYRPRFGSPRMSAARLDCRASSAHSTA